MNKLTQKHELACLSQANREPEVCLIKAGSKSNPANPGEDNRTLPVFGGSKLEVAYTTDHLNELVSALERQRSLVVTMYKDNWRQFKKNAYEGPYDPATIRLGIEKLNSSLTQLQDSEINIQQHISTLAQAVSGIVTVMQQYESGCGPLPQEHPNLLNEAMIMDVDMSFSSDNVPAWQADIQNATLIRSKYPIKKFIGEVECEHTYDNALSFAAEISSSVESVRVLIELRGVKNNSGVLMKPKGDFLQCFSDYVSPQLMSIIVGKIKRKEVTVTYDGITEKHVVERMPDSPLGCLSACAWALCQEKGKSISQSTLCAMSRQVITHTDDIDIPRYRNIKEALLGFSLAQTLANFPRIVLIAEGAITSQGFTYIYHPWRIITSFSRPVNTQLMSCQMRGWIYMYSEESCPTRKNSDVSPLPTEIKFVTDSPATPFLITPEIEPTLIEVGPVTHMQSLIVFDSYAELAVLWLDRIIAYGNATGDDRDVFTLVENLTLDVFASTYTPPEVRYFQIGGTQYRIRRGPESSVFGCIAALYFQSMLITGENNLEGLAMFSRKPFYAVNQLDIPRFRSVQDAIIGYSVAPHSVLWLGPIALIMEAVVDGIPVYHPWYMDNCFSADLGLSLHLADNSGVCNMQKLTQVEFDRIISSGLKHAALGAYINSTFGMHFSVFESVFEYIYKNIVNPAYVRLVQLSTEPLYHEFEGEFYRYQRCPENPFGCYIGLLDYLAEEQGRLLTRDEILKTLPVMQTQDCPWKRYRSLREAVINHKIKGVRDCVLIAEASVEGTLIYHPYFLFSSFGRQSCTFPAHGKLAMQKKVLNFVTVNRQSVDGVKESWMEAIIDEKLAAITTAPSGPHCLRNAMYFQIADSLARVMFASLPFEMLLSNTGLDTFHLIPSVSSLGETNTYYQALSSTKVDEAQFDCLCSRFDKPIPNKNGTFIKRQISLLKEWTENGKIANGCHAVYVISRKDLPRAPPSRLFRLICMTNLAAVTNVGAGLPNWNRFDPQFLISSVRNKFKLKPDQKFRLTPASLRRSKNGVPIELLIPVPPAASTSSLVKEEGYLIFIDYDEKGALFFNSIPWRVAPVDSYKPDFNNVLLKNKRLVHQHSVSLKDLRNAVSAKYKGSPDRAAFVPQVEKIKEPVADIQEEKPVERKSDYVVSPAMALLFSTMARVETAKDNGTTSSAARFGVLKPSKKLTTGSATYIAPANLLPVTEVFPVKLSEPVAQLPLVDLSNEKKLVQTAPDQVFPSFVGLGEASAIDENVNIEDLVIAFTEEYRKELEEEKATGEEDVEEAAAYNESKRMYSPKGVHETLASPKAKKLWGFADALDEKMAEAPKKTGHVTYDVEEIERALRYATRELPKGTVVGEGVSIGDVKYEQLMTMPFTSLSSQVEQTERQKLLDAQALVDKVALEEEKKRRKKHKLSAKETISKVSTSSSVRNLKPSGYHKTVKIGNKRFVSLPHSVDATCLPRCTGLNIWHLDMRNWGLVTPVIVNPDQAWAEKNRLAAVIDVKTAYNYYEFILWMFQTHEISFEDAQARWSNALLLPDDITRPADIRVEREKTVDKLPHERLLWTTGKTPQYYDYPAVVHYGPWSSKIIRRFIPTKIMKSMEKMLPTVELGHAGNRLVGDLHLNLIVNRLLSRGNDIIDIGSKYHRVLPELYNHGFDKRVVCIRPNTQIQGCGDLDYNAKYYTEYADYHPNVTIDIGLASMVSAKAAEFVQPGYDLMAVDSIYYEGVYDYIRRYLERFPHQKAYVVFNTAVPYPGNYKYFDGEGTCDIREDKSELCRIIDGNGLLKPTFGLIMDVQMRGNDTRYCHPLWVWEHAQAHSQFDHNGLYWKNLAFQVTGQFMSAQVFEVSWIRPPQPVVYDFRGHLIKEQAYFHPIYHAHAQTYWTSISNKMVDVEADKPETWADSVRIDVNHMAACMNKRVDGITTEDDFYFLMNAVYAYVSSAVHNFARINSSAAQVRANTLPSFMKCTWFSLLTKSYMIRATLVLMSYMLLAMSAVILTATFCYNFYAVIYRHWFLLIFWHSWIILYCLSAYVWIVIWRHVLGDWYRLIIYHEVSAFREGVFPVRGPAPRKTLAIVVNNFVKRYVYGRRKLHVPEVTYVELPDLEMTDTVEMKEADEMFDGVEILVEPTVASWNKAAERRFGPINGVMPLRGRPPVKKWYTEAPEHEFPELDNRRPRIMERLTNSPYRVYIGIAVIVYFIWATFSLYRYLNVPTIATIIETIPAVAVAADGGFDEPWAVRWITGPALGLYSGLNVTLNGGRNATEDAAAVEDSFLKLHVLVDAGLVDFWMPIVNLFIVMIQIYLLYSSFSGVVSAILPSPIKIVFYIIAMGFPVGIVSKYGWYKVCQTLGPFLFKLAYNGKSFAFIRGQLDIDVGPNPTVNMTKLGNDQFRDLMDAQPNECLDLKQDLDDVKYNCAHVDRLNMKDQSQRFVDCGYKHDVPQMEGAPGQTVTRPFIMRQAPAEAAYALLVRQCGHHHLPAADLVAQFSAFVRPKIDYIASQMTYDPMPFEEYASRHPPKKAKRYIAAWNKFLLDGQIDHRLDAIQKGGEQHYGRLGEQKPRMIFSPSDSANATGAYLNSIYLNSLAGLKGKDGKLKPQIVPMAVGRNSSQVAEMLQKASDEVRDPVPITWDGSTHDSHQFAVLILAVDVYFFSVTLAFCIAAMGLSLIHYRSIYTLVTSLKQVFRLYRPTFRRGPRSLLASGTITGTVFSGHATRTTLGNSLRVYLYVCFIAHLAGLVEHRDFSVVVAGDDVVCFVSRGCLPAFRVAFARVYINGDAPGFDSRMPLTHGLGQVSRSYRENNSMIDFLSKTGVMMPGGRILFNRKLQRALISGNFSCKLRKNYTAANQNYNITMGLKAWGRTVPVVIQYILRRIWTIPHKAGNYVPPDLAYSIRLHSSDYDLDPIAQAWYRAALGIHHVTCMEGDVAQALRWVDGITD